MLSDCNYNKTKMITEISQLLGFIESTLLKTAKKTQRMTALNEYNSLSLILKSTLIC